MSNNPPKWYAWCFASSILIGAFLVFQVQPVISKTILPWFGGSPAVWTTCMLFFQVLLFGGYLYAHLSVKYLTPAWQGAVHALLVIAAVSLLPIMPNAGWKPVDSQNPTWRILLLLGANVGLPYFLLSSTAPLIQSWFSQTYQGKSPYRLYALSNAGSLVALLSYPFVFEPAMGVQSQSAFWTIGFCVFALFCGLTALMIRRQPPSEKLTSTSVEPHSGKPPTIGQYLFWLIMPAFASVMLLAATNHICQDVAVIPFLWVAPLSLYLLTFIICFDNQKWYSKRWCSVGALVSILLICGLEVFDLHNFNLVFEVGINLSAMFFICMLCHGELVHHKPAPKWLTAFYLMSSAGGALGGILVAIICPVVFVTFFEMNLGILVAYLVATGYLLAANWGPWATKHGLLKPLCAVLLFFGLLTVVRGQFGQNNLNAIEVSRNFYGVLSVLDSFSDNPEDQRRELKYGRITHGTQLMFETKKRIPTTYYGTQSGVGIALNYFSGNQPNRVGVIGLGVGTLAAYGRDNDYFRFYEINPDVCNVARDHFTFLKDCPSHVDVVLGDARLSMEQEPAQKLNVLVIDAFSGDAVPAHLLTAEAMTIYRKHVAPGGVIAIHISNRHIDLMPVVTALSEKEKLQLTFIETHTGDKKTSTLPSQWVLLSNNETFLNNPVVLNAVSEKPTAIAPVLWTDEYSNLVGLLK